MERKSIVDEFDNWWKLVKDKAFDEESDREDVAAEAFIAGYKFGTDQEYDVDILNDPWED
jgi:hypothetical protein